MPKEQWKASKTLPKPKEKFGGDLVSTVRFVQIKLQVAGQSALSIAKKINADSNNAMANAA